MRKTKNIFSIALKSIAFAWKTNRKLFLLIICLNIFMGAVVYVQYTSFSSIVDEIIAIKQRLSNTTALIRSCVILGCLFLFQQ